MILNEKSKTFLGCLRQVVQAYQLRGFQIRHLFMDGQFDPLRSDLADMGISLNIVANSKHVPEIEHCIRTIKECARGVWNTPPFKKWPRHLVIKLIYAQVFWLNMFPFKDGVSGTLSLQQIVTGLELNYTWHC